MWWILRFPDFFTPIAALWQFIASLDIGMRIGQFLFAGIIPGTNIEISFYQLAAIFWLLILLYVGSRITKFANNNLSSFKLNKKQFSS